MERNRMAMTEAALPNFLIAGAARAGTTALHYLLQQHPDIYMSAYKEPHFFAFTAETSDSVSDSQMELRCPPDKAAMQNLQQRSTHSLKQYKKLFLNAAERTAVGEASPLYLASPGAPQRIQALLPSAKIIIMLRNPVDRAYSHYVQNTRGGNHQLPSFPELLNAENDVSQSLTAFAQQKRDFYVGLSQYADAIAAYQATFPSENIRIYLFEDFKQNSEKIVKDIFQFLGVDENINIDTQKRYNASGTSKFQFIDTLLLSGNPLKTLLRSTLPPALKNKLSAIQNSARDLNSKPSPKLSTQTRQQLTDRYFQADIQRLETLINRDLSCWLNTARVYT